ncbi:MULTISPECIES: thioredoxin [Caproicibacterium]|uniref:Thioredoxin n=1 Tax=Caproicibacterium argilliputei TaxID=3030016 RepID=A0AA97H3A9_9FIRM|nr:thioredoxin [Caproicibacterium argilliputei]WOC33017.1 thioredoxin [Caproicibacterium argilliputei]
MAVCKVTKENYKAEVLQSEKPVLIDFWASWCGPCKMLSPVVDEIAEEQNRVKVCKVNVDEQPELAAQFQVMSIPTLAFLKNGQLTAQSVGVRPKSDILQMIEA